jgi:hypothetical protein
MGEHRFSMFGTEFTVTIAKSTSLPKHAAIFRENWIFEIHFFPKAFVDIFSRIDSLRHLSVKTFEGLRKSCFLANFTRLFCGSVELLGRDAVFRTKSFSQ